MEVTQLGGVGEERRAQQVGAQQSALTAGQSHQRQSSGQNEGEGLLRGCAKGLATAMCQPQLSPNLHLSTRPLFTGHVHDAPRYRLKLSMEPAAETGTAHPLLQARHVPQALQGGRSGAPGTESQRSWWF